ncbi:hypothetical protein D3C85_1219710 [compost metagenome]
MNRQVGQQALQFVLATGNAQRLVQFHGWRNQAIDNGFGYYVRDSDPKQDLLLVGLGSQQGFQFATQLKHLLGVGQGLATGLGQFQLSSDSPEQFDPVGLLQQADLPADGLGRQVQLFAGTHNAAGFGHDPEVMQLPIIEHGTRRFVKTEV